jgi:hypothetical protein
LLESKLDLLKLETKIVLVWIGYAMAMQDDSFRRASRIMCLVLLVHLIKKKRSKTYKYILIPAMCVIRQHLITKIR